MKIPLRLTKPANTSHFGVMSGATVMLDLEEYLIGVVASEIYEGSTPSEAIKAQAIASRSYAVWKALSGIVMDDTTTYQSYSVEKGLSAKNTANAVSFTSGQILTYGGKVIEAYYSSSNGGTTKRSDEVWKTALAYFVNRADPWDVAAREEYATRGKTVKISHGVGLSQVGAEYAAKIGINCADILAFYYPGTVISTMEGESNMAKPKASAVCTTSIACAKKQPPIPYVWGKESATQQDCQGHIEFCVRENGGTMSYAGSNDMFRNACSWVGTLAEAKAKGYYIPGALLFQVKPGGDYPEKYHADGKGNAQHIGYLIAGLQGIEVVHASSSAGKVTTGTMNSTWNFLGLAKAIDYSEYLGGSTDNTTSTPEVSVPIPDVSEGEVVGIVTADRNGLNMRAIPGGEYLLKIPTNSQIVISETMMHDGELWGKTQWPNAKGEVFPASLMMSYVELHREEDTTVRTLSVVIPVSDEATANQLMDLYSGSYLMEVNG